MECMWCIACLLAHSLLINSLPYDHHTHPVAVNLPIKQWLVGNIEPTSMYAVSFVIIMITQYIHVYPNLHYYRESDPTSTLVDLQ